MKYWIATTALVVAIIGIAGALSFRSDIRHMTLDQLDVAAEASPALVAEALQMPLVAASSTFIAHPSDATTTSSTPGVPNTTWRAGFLREPTVLPGEHALRVPVLMYHQIREQKPDADRVNRLMTVSPENFAKQMQDLVASGYATITPDELTVALTGGALPPKPVLITFDDGYRNQYDHAYPVLKRLGLKATFFIISGYVGHPAYMDKTEIRDMLDAGVATVASHTVSHHGLVDTKPPMRMREIVDSKTALEAMFHVPVTTFAYPYGNHNAEVMKEVAAAGYASAYSTFLGSTQTASSRMELRRIRVNDGEPLVPLLENFSK